MAKEIPLTQGKVTLVDDEDYDDLVKHKWYAVKHRNTYYAYRKDRINGKQTTVYMHRVIMDAKKGEMLDHIDGDGLNNRRYNLRRVEPVAGSQDVTRRHNWSEFRDRCTGSRNVSFEFEGDAFHVSAMINGYVFTYSERLPTKRLKVTEDETRFVIEKTHLNDIDLFQFLIDGKLKCGVTLAITCSRSLLSDKQFLFDLNYDSARVKAFLVKELGVTEI